MQSICCFWWTKTTEELLPGEEKKKTRAKQNTQEEKREWGWRCRVPLRPSSSSRFTELSLGTGSGQACLLSAFICLRPLKAVLKTGLWLYFLAIYYPIVCQPRAPKAAYCLEICLPAQHPPRDTCIAAGRKGKEAKVCHFFTIWKHAAMFSHPHWFVDLHLECKKLDYRPGGSNVKIYKPPHEAKSPWEHCNRFERKGRQAQGGMDKMEGKSQGKVLEPVSPSLDPKS